MRLVRTHNEECWALVGTRRGRVWTARRVRYRTGEPTRVTADGPWVLAREERRRDVLGFLHTHPMGWPRPSARDVRTMRAWCDALGKPLLCLIATPRRVVGFRFDDFACRGKPVATVSVRPRGVVVAVETMRKNLTLQK